LAPPAPSAIDPETRERMESIGYSGGGATAREDDLEDETETSKVER
jgi:hypothetical protein